MKPKAGFLEKLKQEFLEDFEVEYYANNPVRGLLQSFLNESNLKLDTSTTLQLLGELGCILDCNAYEASGRGADFACSEEGRELLEETLIDYIMLHEPEEKTMNTNKLLNISYEGPVVGVVFTDKPDAEIHYFKTSLDLTIADVVIVKLIRPVLTDIPVADVVITSPIKYEVAYILGTVAEPEVAYIPGTVADVVITNSTKPEVVYILGTVVKVGNEDLLDIEETVAYDWVAAKLDETAYLEHKTEDTLQIKTFQRLQRSNIKKQLLDSLTIQSLTNG